MLIHQEADDSHDEFWIELDQIRSITKHIDEETYIVYLAGCKSYYEITQDTFNKIIAEKGVI